MFDMSANEIFRIDLLTVRSAAMSKGRRRQIPQKSASPSRFSKPMKTISAPMSEMPPMKKTMPPSEGGGAFGSSG